VNRTSILRVGLVLLALSAQIATGQQVTLSLRQPPPNQFALTDLWQLTVIYVSATGAAAPPITVRLVGTVRTVDLRQQGGLIVTATTSTFTLNGGTRVFTSQSINAAAPVQVQWTNQKIRDAVSATGQFPTGQYSACVEIFIISGNGTRSLATDCINVTVEVTSPPMLVSPATGTSVELKYPIFTWTPPVPVSPRTRVQYTLKMVELHGRQTAGAAMQTNPAWLEQPSVGGTTIQYPPAARELKAGQHYAWMVFASTDGFPLGKSEVWEFTYQPAGLIVAPTPSSGIKPKDRLDVLEELLRSCREASGSSKPVITK
jgi:hypothetical protein